MLNRILSFFINMLLRFPNLKLKDRIRDLFYAGVVSERIVEYPLVFKHLSIREGKILDVGCYYSNLPIQLASLGYKVWGVDIQPYKLTHKNFSFCRGDIRKTDFEDNFFDAVLSVSTIEHIGLSYYKEVKDAAGDRNSLKEIARILKPGGELLLTVPFGKYRVNVSERIYDLDHLKVLLEGLNIEEILYFKDDDGSWVPAEFDEVKDLDSKNEIKAFSFVKARKDADINAE